MSKYQQFIFEDYEFDSATNTAKFHYSFDGKVNFTETIRWHVEAVNYDRSVLYSALFALWIMAGISYYKAYIPSEIIIKKGQLNVDQKKFFDSIYTNGLSQFFYTNQLDWKELVDFPIGETIVSTDMRKMEISGKAGLVALGGGKDSIVASELVNALELDTASWVINHAKRFDILGKTIGKPLLSVTRQLDPQLLQLNETDAYNGHIPITAIVGFVGVVLAILTGRKSLVWAIESSTDEPNIIWKGLEVNHQYSKSSMFEAEMANYIQTNIASNMEYYSILRPLSELRIAEVFCNHYFDKYKGLFSSCNLANFKQGNTDQMTWCGECPKCAFVYAIFSPFLPKAKLMELFSGKDLFADGQLRGTFEQMLGIDGHKPLECVGEVAEVRTALQMSKDSGQYPVLAQFDFPKPDYDYKLWHNNRIPDQIETKLKEILASL